MASSCMYLQGCPLPTAKFSPMERRWYQGDWWQQAAAVGTPEVNVRTCSPKWVHPATLPGRSLVDHPPSTMRWCTCPTTKTVPADRPTAMQVPGHPQEPSGTNCGQCRAVFVSAAMFFFPIFGSLFLSGAFPGLVFHHFARSVCVVHSRTHQADAGAVVGIRKQCLSRRTKCAASSSASGGSVF